MIAGSTIVLSGASSSPATTTTQTFTITEPALTVTVTPEATSSSHLEARFTVRVSHASSSLAPAVDVEFSTNLAGMNMLECYAMLLIMRCRTGVVRLYRR